MRLREKQKVKRYYGLWEKQFMRFFRMAEKRKGNTGAALLELLERRLDNVVCKMGFAASRKESRQLITHGHIYVNSHKLDRPSYVVNRGDVISVKPSDKSRKLIQSCLEAYGGRGVPSWLSVDTEAMTGTVLAIPERDSVQIPVEENLIVEFCSR
jgi:small subunit ribosomal protein S4